MIICQQTKIDKKYITKILTPRKTIDAKSLKDIGRKDEYEMELKSLEDMKLSRNLVIIGFAISLGVC